MKKVITLLVLVFAFTLTTNAQKKKGKNQVKNILAKMTKELDLTDAQQNKIKPLLVSQLEDRKLMMDERKKLQDSGEKPSKDTRKKMRADRLAKETAMNDKMESILTKEQFVKFIENAKNKRGKNKLKRKNSN